MNFVIHALLKDLNSPVRERYREELIPPTDEESGFVEKVTKLFRSLEIFESFPLSKKSKTATTKKFTCSLQKSNRPQIPFKPKSWSA